mgnify:FL=1
MVVIYCIEDCDGLKYVGSTCRTLEERFREHKSHRNCSSNKLNLDKCKIYPLEETDEENRKLREQFWIDKTECVNHNGTTPLGNEQRKEYNKEYHDKNKEYLLKEHKDKYYYVNSFGGDPRYNNNLLKIDFNIFM